MIAYVRGLLTEKEPSFVVVEAAGVGYEVMISLATYDKLPKTGATVKLFVSHWVREDDEALYGFATVAEKEMFSKLTQVNGVGPRSALAILSALSLGDLSLAIASGQAKRLATVKGIGKKTAEKICVELKDKVNAIEALSATQEECKGEQASVIHDAILALHALGFGDEVATKMVSEAVMAHPEVKNAEALVRFALQQK